MPAKKKTADPEPRAEASVMPSRQAMLARSKAWETTLREIMFDTPGWFRDNADRVNAALHNDRSPRLVQGLGGATLGQFTNIAAAYLKELRQVKDGELIWTYLRVYLQELKNTHEGKPEHHVYATAFAATLEAEESSPKEQPRESDNHRLDLTLCSFLSDKKHACLLHVLGIIFPYTWDKVTLRELTTPRAADNLCDAFHRADTALARGMRWAQLLEVLGTRVESCTGPEHRALSTLLFHLRGASERYERYTGNAPTPAEPPLERRGAVSEVPEDSVAACLAKPLLPVMMELAGNEMTKQQAERAMHLAFPISWMSLACHNFASYADKIRACLEARGGADGRAVWGALLEGLRRHKGNPEVSPAWREAYRRMLAAMESTKLSPAEQAVKPVQDPEVQVPDTALRREYAMRLLVGMRTHHTGMHPAAAVRIALADVDALFAALAEEKK